MRRILKIASAGICFAGAVAAQSPDVTMALAGHEALQRGEYLKADKLLKAAGLNSDGTIRNEGAFQSWDQVHPMLTGEVPIGGLRPRDLKILDGDTGPSHADFAALAAATPRDAIEEIVQRAKETSVVILNEAHDSPRDRAFALEVARALRPLGYTYLAAETFNNASDWGGQPSTEEKLQRDGFVRRDTGYYTADPVFAGFVRVALTLGYHPISYEQTEKQGAEDPAGSIATREEAEAQNLEAVLRKHPGAKMFVYVGYSHVAEEPIGAGMGRNTWMGARLKMKTGIDPLTIDQTTLTDQDPSVAAVYQEATARINRSSIFEAGHAPIVLGRFAGAVDLQVVHPRRSYRFGRPKWLNVFGGHPIQVPTSLLPTQRERLIQAFSADAPDDAIPLDQVVVEPNRPPAMLMVPAGRLRFRVQDAD